MRSTLKKQRFLWGVLIFVVMAFGLVACKANAPKSPTPDTATHSPAYALTQVDVPSGFVVQLALGDDKKPLIINNQGELWRLADNRPLVKGVSKQVTPVAGFGKIALADRLGKFMLLQVQNDTVATWSSDISLSSVAGMAMLPHATIAVQDERGVAHLVRIEVETAQNARTAQVVARFATPVLPDSKPVQVALVGDDAHIAVLASPDETTYRHGVLGDAIEAGELHYLERHSLTPLLSPLAVRGLVFEGNQLEVLPAKNGNRLIAVMAGNGAGAKTVVVGEQTGKLSVLAQSEPLPMNRWQSPFVVGGALYAVQMPHLVGALVRYDTAGQALVPTALADGMSNHAISERETNLVASTLNFAVVPHRGYQRVSVLNEQGLSDLPTTLPARIVKSVANDKTVFLLLDNGQVWQVQAK